ncbi:hypothetical protein AWB70_06393 [Caballeronia cordobensis]|uniref:Uncharacterized protein n=1 Tax=Caballeronia cordobensis TaxID=1353886 RepID=A0A158JDR3_CABCO|nr:hypothetical protein AWB70_06393 [Caballeronia cordobensis]
MPTKDVAKCFIADNLMRNRLFRAKWIALELRKRHHEVMKSYARCASKRMKNPLKQGLECGFAASVC